LWDYNLAMATRAELGLRVGDIAVWGYASKPFDLPSGHKAEVSGVPWDTPGAEVTVSVGQVLEVKPKETILQCITALTDRTFEPDRTGRKRSLHNRYPGFLDSEGTGDEELEEQLERAGIQITSEPEPTDPSFTYYYVTRKNEQT